MIYGRQLYGLERAKKAGAFVRLGSDSENFAQNFNLGWIIYDSIGTYACIKAEPELTISQISRAWLSDDQDKVQPLADIFEITEEAAAQTGFPQHRLVLFFGPVSEKAKRVRLEIQRLEPSGQGIQYFNSIVDPFSELTEEKALHVMAWEEPDDPMAMIPMGTVAGCWDFNVDCPRHNGAWEEFKHYTLNQEAVIGDCTMHLDDLYKGLTGWHLTAHFPSEANRGQNQNKLQDQLWQCSSPDELIYRLCQKGLLEDFAPPTIRFDLQKGSESLEITETYGPVGPLNNKYHFFFPPFADEQAVPEKISINKILEMPLKEHWYYTFDPKVISTAPAIIKAAMPSFSLKLRLSIKGLFWEDDMMLISPIVEELEGCSAQISLADCLLCNHSTGESCFCLGQTLVDLPQPKTTINREQVYGWQYPPIHKTTREASFEVCTISLTPKEPIIIDINPVPYAPVQEDEEENPEE